MFGQKSRFNGGVEVVNPSLSEVSVLRFVTQNIIPFNLLVSGEAKKKNHKSRNVDFPGLCFGAVDNFKSSGLFIASRQTQIRRTRLSSSACPREPGPAGAR